MNRMTKEKFPFSYARVRFQDCDPLGHLNNGRYFDYFMNAREDQLEEFYGLDIYDRLKKSGKAWVVSRSEIHYRKPAFLMEKILLRSCVLNYSARHIEVEMAMYDEKGLKLKALLRTVFIPFDARTSSVYEHEGDLLDLLKEVRAEGITPDAEERIAQLEGRLVRS